MVLRSLPLWWDRSLDPIDIIYKVRKLDGLTQNILWTYEWLTVQGEVLGLLLVPFIGGGWGENLLLTSTSSPVSGRGSWSLLRLWGKVLEDECVWLLHSLLRPDSQDTFPSALSCSRCCKVWARWGRWKSAPSRASGTGKACHAGSGILRKSSLREVWKPQFRTN